MITWDTPMMPLVPQLRRLQYAANMLTVNEFAEALGHPVDDYLRHKFVEFQKLGRLHVFDDSVLQRAVEFYERQVAEREERSERAGTIPQGTLPGSQEEHTPAGPVIGTTEVGPRRHTERMIERAPEDR